MICLQKPDSLSAFSRTLSLIIQLCKCGCRTHPWRSPFPSSHPYVQPINKSFQCFHLRFWIYSFAISPATSISEAIIISHWTATVVCLLLSDPFEAHIWLNLFQWLLFALRMAQNPPDEYRLCVALLLPSLLCPLSSHGSLCPTMGDCFLTFLKFTMASPHLVSLILFHFCLKYNLLFPINSYTEFRAQVGFFLALLDPLV